MKTDDLIVKTVSGRGRGVIAARPFRTNDIVHVAPVVVLPEQDVNGVLDQYVFEWQPKQGLYAIAMGLGSLFNHSKRPNLRFSLRIARKEIVFRACRDIEVGDECVSDYGYLVPNYDGR